MTQLPDPLYVLLGQIHTHLQRSKITYNHYLQDGKKYLNAKTLRTCNSEIRDLLLEKGFLLPEDLHKDAITLISHYDIWLEKWDDLCQSREFASDDTFIFKNNHTFPREAAEKLEKEWNRIKTGANLGPQ